MKTEDMRETANTKEPDSHSGGASETESHILLPLINSAFLPGSCLKTVQAMEDINRREIAMGEYYYFSGRPEEVAREMEPYLASRDTGMRLSACLVYAFANLATDNIHLARHALTEVKRTFEKINGEENELPELKAMCSFVSVTSAVLLHMPMKEELACDPELMNLLPSGLRFFYSYVMAHYAYLQGDYGRSIGIAQTALAFEPELYPIPTIYLRLVMVMDYMSLKKSEEAKEQMLLAWEVARPDGLIEAFGEHHGLLGGVLEATLKKNWPEDFKRIIGITYSFSSGWRKVHNPDTGDDVANNLTTTEFAIAMLTARGWTYQEIASHMGISVNTVKFHMGAVIGKLGIEKKSDLKKYMLR
ncbi:MAG: helix-turn-helix transcriptional regulator [Lachnospiraceae bacterium]|nr:helix-turn-helix transcriptional regulator [Lachnospiraceae bacterium]